MRKNLLRTKFDTVNNYKHNSNPFDKVSMQMGGLFRAFEGFLASQVKTFEKEVRAAAKESISPKGKFIRPTLVFAAANAGSEWDESLIRRAAIVELTHLSTLIHDDVIDGANMRRNAETANSKYGAKTAILLGDAIFAHTMGVAACVKTICEGEIRQTLADKTVRVTRQKYYDIAYGKTAALFSLACVLGAKSVKGVPGWTDAAEEAGKQLGIAYQIYDDLCDWFMSEKDAGKTLGTDLLSGKQTFPLIALIETMGDAEAEEFTSNLSIRKPDEIIERMRACGIEDICAAEIGRRIKGAEKAVKGYPELSGKLLDFCAAMRELALG